MCCPCWARPSWHGRRALSRRWHHAALINGAEITRARAAGTAPGRWHRAVPKASTEVAPRTGRLCPCSLSPRNVQGHNPGQALWDPPMLWDPPSAQGPPPHPRMPRDPPHARVPLNIQGPPNAQGPSNALDPLNSQGPHSAQRHPEMPRDPHNAQGHPPRYPETPMPAYPSMSGEHPSAHGAPDAQGLPHAWVPLDGQRPLNIQGPSNAQRPPNVHRPSNVQGPLNPQGPQSAQRPSNVGVSGAPRGAQGGPWGQFGGD